MNISNGALITKHKGRLYVCDLENYRGTYILDEECGVAGRIEGLMWFAATLGTSLYYSDQRDKDYLYCLDTESLSENCLLKRPCGYITVFDDRLFFLDETESLIHELDLKTGKTSPVMRERVSSFILWEGAFYCASAKGLLRFGLYGGKGDLLTEHIPLCLAYSALGPVFADVSHNFALSVLKDGQRTPDKAGRVKTQSLAVEGRYIYAADLTDDCSVVRLHTEGGGAIRFCGERAEKLHIIEDHLYFLNQNDKNAWYKMPLSGGRSIRLLPALPL
ncbi:MAG: DUF5050 domain-containing protein [Clostridiales bacterium]|nr:DUF5050 domain-containing protein [Clostridiales bacterium]